MAYSERIKKEVFNDYCLGTYDNLEQLAAAHGIPRIATVSQWKHKYGWLEKKRKFGSLQSPPEKITQITEDQTPRNTKKQGQTQRKTVSLIENNYSLEDATKRNLLICRELKNHIVVRLNTVRNNPNFAKNASVRYLATLTATLGQIQKIERIEFGADLPDEHSPLDISITMPGIEAAILKASRLVEAQPQPPPVDAPKPADQTIIDVKPASDQTSNQTLNETPDKTSTGS